MALGFIKFVPLSALHGLARLAAYISSAFNLSVYRSIKANLILTRPELNADDRQVLAKEILSNQMTCAVDSVKSWAMPPEWSIRQITRVHHLEILKQGLKHPNGLLLIVPHLGTWEMMNAWISEMGAPTIMYKPVKNTAVDAFVLAGRQRLNSTLVPTDATGVKAVFKALKDGGFSIILPDHVPDPSGGVIAPFFGIETLSSTLAPKLAVKTKCALVGLSCIKRSDGDGYEVFCYDLNDPALYDKDIHIATTAMNRAMEMMINPHFSHCMWGYRRFKMTPLIDNPYLLPHDELLKTAQALRERTDSQGFSADISHQ